MSKGTLVVQLLTRQEISTREMGGAILGQLVQLAPRLAPEKYGNWEPMTKVFPVERIESVLNDWHSPFLWRRAKPKVKGTVFFGVQARNHSFVYLTAPFQSDLLMDARTFAIQVADFVKADIGIVHLLGKDEEAMLHPEIVGLLWDGFTTASLEKGIPTLGWFTYFGNIYCRHFGKDRLLAAPAAKAVAMANGVAVTLTQNPTDALSGFQAFDEIRRKVIVHLGEESFHGCGSGSSRVPQFWQR